MTNPTTETTVLPALLREAHAHQDHPGQIPWAAMLGQLMGPEVALDDRQPLMAATITYLTWPVPPAPWQLDEALCQTYGTLVWTHPDDRMLVDVPLLRGLDDPLLTDDVRDRVRAAIDRDHDVHTLEGVRVMPLLAPTLSRFVPPQVPLRSQPLVGCRFAFDLTPAALPAALTTEDR